MNSVLNMYIWGRNWVPAQQLVGEPTSFSAINKFSICVYSMQNMKSMGVGQVTENYLCWGPSSHKIYDQHILEISELIFHIFTQFCFHFIDMVSQSNNTKRNLISKAPSRMYTHQFQHTAQYTNVWSASKMAPIAPLVAEFGTKNYIMLFLGSFSRIVDQNILIPGIFILQPWLGQVPHLIATGPSCLC